MFTNTWTSREAGNEAGQLPIWVHYENNEKVTNSWQNLDCPRRSFYWLLYIFDLYNAMKPVYDI